MRNAIFLVVLVCLLTSCNGKGPTLKLKTEVDVTSERGLPVKIEPQDEKPLPVKVAPDEIAVRAVIAFLIIACATIGAVFAAWRAAGHTKRAVQGWLFYELIHRYDSKEMYEALQRVRKWGKEEVGEDKLGRDDETWDALNNGEVGAASRRLTHYYLGVLQLKKLKYISKGKAREIFKVVSADVLDVLEPLEKALIRDKNEGNQQRISKEIKRLEKDFNEIRALAE